VDRKQRSKRIVILVIVAVAALALTAGYFALKQAGCLYMLDSAEALRDWVNGFGAWGPAIFFLIQFAQVILAPIPGAVTGLAGGLLFGFWKGVLISVMAMLLGAVAAFLLARRFGRPFVRYMVGEKIMEKYVDALGGRSMGLLFMMFLLPFFPDDALCFIAGLTAIPLPVFVIAVVLTRPLGMIFSTMVGSGIITVPIWLWVVIGLLSAGFLWISWKYGDVFNQKLLDWMLRVEKKKDDK